MVSCTPLVIHDAIVGEAKEYNDFKGISKELLPYYEGFMSQYNSVHDKETFIFFSDPHLLGNDNSFTLQERIFFESSFNSMKCLYDKLPIDFCLCGGDWLNSKDTQDAAIRKLQFANEKMKDWFPRYYKILGNHDTNYQGIVSADNSSRGDLPDSIINNVYFNDTGSAFYFFKVKQTLFIILDTGIDWQTSINEYRKQQIEWLSQLLLVSKESHIVIGMHIFYNVYDTIKTRTPMSLEVMGLCNAFNKREVYESNYLTCDFTNAHGIVHFILCGHNHVDFEYYENDIPCIAITKFISDGKPSFDLCMIDYDNGYLETVRIGTGENRHIRFYQ